MKRRQITKSGNSKQLLARLVDSPALPALVAQMPAPTLKRLIDHVGLRDSGALIALTTPEQLREIFEESLWQNLIPGQAERLQPGKFLEWLDVMLDVGTAFAAERLCDLGETFVVLNLAPFVTVSDRSADVYMAPEESTEAFTEFLHDLAAGDRTEEFGGYFVAATHEDEWDSIRAVLNELESSHGNFLERVLSRCCFQPTALGFADDGQPLLEDETYEREQRRAAKGFVTPDLAASFLALARRTSLDMLCAQSAYDDIGQLYFDRLRAASAKHDPAADDSGEQPGEEIAAATTPAQAAELASLKDALVTAEIVSNAPPKLLTGPKNSREPMPELQLRLDHLQLTNSHAFSARLGELVFLANVLMAGSWFEGGRFKEAEAAQAALACANLGLDYVASRLASSRDRDDFVAGMLEDAPGIVRLFQIGWHLLQRLPRASAEALISTLRSDQVREGLKNKLWMLAEVEIAVSEPDLLELVERGEFEDVADNLLLLTLVLDQRACDSLRTLITSFPRYPLQLNLGFRPGPATTGSQYITTLRHLQRVDQFLAQLGGLIRTSRSS